MSDASKCDLCGALFERSIGDITIEAIHVLTEKSATSDSWSEIDFCSACSAKLYELIAPALVDPPGPI